MYGNSISIWLGDSNLHKWYCVHEHIHTSSVHFLWHSLSGRYVIVSAIDPWNSPAVDHELIYSLGTSWRRGEPVSSLHQLHYLWEWISTEIKHTYIYMHNLAKGVPGCLNIPQMVCVQCSISHTSQLHSSIHHWQWSTSWSIEPVQTLNIYINIPQVLGILLEITV